MRYLPDGQTCAETKIAEVIVENPLQNQPSKMRMAMLFLKENERVEREQLSRKIVITMIENKLKANLQTMRREL